MNVKVRGMGNYLPKRIVSGEDVDKIIGKKLGWTSNYVGVKERRYASDDETVSIMGKEAILKALEDANMSLSELDAICYTGASVEQIIPSTACLIQRHLGLGDSGISCFDINSTCLSFLSALDNLSYAIEAGRYKNVAIVASEKASCAINPKEPESFALFGDGAVAMIISKTPSNESSKIINAMHKTYGDGADFCCIKAGGSLLPPTPSSVTPETEGLFKFHMDGRKVFKLSLDKVPSFLNELLDKSNLTLKDIQMVCPHQASSSAMRLIRKKLNIPEDKFMVIIENYGNMIAASIPMAFYFAVKEGKIKRGDKALLMGTSAGLSIGGLILEY